MQRTAEIADKLYGLLSEQLAAPDSLSAMEQQTRETALEVQRQALEHWLAHEAAAEARTSAIACDCGRQATYLFRRAGVLRTLFGKVRYKRRYYLCAHCHTGTYPLDRKLGLRPNAISAEVERLAGLVGVQQAFEKGSGIFEELTLLSLSDQTLDKAAQAYGAQATQQEGGWHAEAHDLEEWQRRKRETKRPRRLYGAIDGLKVHIRPENEGDEPWRELKLGAWFIARGQPPTKPDGEWKVKAEQMTYYTDICHAHEFGKLSWATGFQRNAHRADELIILGDGARWIWDLVVEHFPDAIQIVDWFHACEYIAPVAKVAFREKEKRKEWIEAVKTALWEGRLDDVIAACQAHVNPNREDDPAQKAVTYYTNNRSRMDYPTYRANGYQIGSGTVESAAKQIGQQRLKIAGARWELQSARNVAKARAAFLSDQWLDIAAQRTHLPLAV